MSYDVRHYDVTGRLDHGTVPPDPDPDRTFLGLLHRELNAVTGREKETRAALAEHQAKADACTREREAIERAIKAYQQQDNRAAAADITAYVRREGDR